MPIVNILIEREKKRLTLNIKNLKELFKKLKINPESVIVIKNNELVAEDTKLKNKDEIRLLSVISGG